MKIEIISGNPRTESVTRRVAIHLKNALSRDTNATVGFIDMLECALPPVQNVWQRVEEAPTSVRAIADRVFNADAYVLVTPEYNGSYSPALKNFLDHFPKRERKTFGIVAASPGALGGIRAALQLQTLVDGLFGIGSPKMLIVPAVDAKFDAEGVLTDTSFRPAVETFMNEFLWLAHAIVNAGTMRTRLVD